MIMVMIMNVILIVNMVVNMDVTNILKLNYIKIEFY